MPRKYSISQTYIWLSHDSRMSKRIDDSSLCRNLLNCESLAGFEVAFAAEPVFHGGLKTGKWDAVPHFEQAVSRWKRIVKDRIIGEIAHGKVVDPVDGARGERSRGVNPLDGEHTRKHALSVIDNRDQGFLSSTTLVSRTSCVSTRKRL